MKCNHKWKTHKKYTPILGMCKSLVQHIAFCSKCGIHKGDYMMNKMADETKKKERILKEIEKLEKESCKSISGFDWYSKR